MWSSIAWVSMLNLAKHPACAEGYAVNAPVDEDKMLGSYKHMRASRSTQGSGVCYVLEELEEAIVPDYPTIISLLLYCVK